MCLTESFCAPECDVLLSIIHSKSVLSSLLGVHTLKRGGKIMAKPFRITSSSGFLTNQVANQAFQAHIRLLIQKKKKSHEPSFNDFSSMVHLFKKQF